MKNIPHGFLNKTAGVELDDIVNEMDDMSVKEEMRSCQHFFMVLMTSTKET